MAHALTEPIRDAGEVRALAEALTEAKSYALDLEFVSDGRYVPELGLVQVGWGDPDDPIVCAIDPVAVDPAPVLALTGDPTLETVLHGGQADLALIAYRFGVRPACVVDTQIAAAFLGLGEQVGFASAVEQELGTPVDKGPQFTDWLKRPLSTEQLRYALDDVRLLLPLWARLRGRLEGTERMAWVRDESERLGQTAATRMAPEVCYRKVGGYGKLQPKELGRLRALAAWREQIALDANRPPSWILPDPVMTALARRPPVDARDLAGTRAMPKRTAERCADEILAVLTEGEASPVERPPRPPRRPADVEALAPLVGGLVQAASKEHDIAARFVGTRADIEAFIAWWDDGKPEPAEGVRMMEGWRRALIGEELLRFLDGERAIAVDRDAPSQIRLVDPDSADRARRLD
jgi:ribonuclease D